MESELPMKTLQIVVGSFLVGVLGAFAQPSITIQPQSRSNMVGTVVTLLVEATGTPPLFYQWRRQSANVAGETNAVLVIASLQNSNAGIYTVVSTNRQGAVTSLLARVTVLAPPVIVSQPVERSAEVGAGATNQVAATGTAPLAYQWRRNHTALPGRTHPASCLLTSGSPTPATTRW